MASNEHMHYFNDVYSPQAKFQPKYRKKARHDFSRLLVSGWNSTCWKKHVALFFEFAPEFGV